MLNMRLIRMYFNMNWVKIAVISVILIVILLSILGLASMESFYQRYTLATLPISVLLAGISAGVFVFMYMGFFSGRFSQFKKSTIKSHNVDVHFSDVIGVDEAKEEAWEVVELIKDRKRLAKIGGKILRGLLLVGPPGCGKTLIAKAIATEAGIPFISMSGSEFTEIFVGVGASRVRKLFKRARGLVYGYGACIIFIDELDAIGRQRSFSFMGGGGETNSTQNQLLVEMDGLKEKDCNIIVIGATNAEESILDPALLRPGRFDRKVYIDRPGLEGREKLFAYYLGKVKYDSSINVGHLARKSVYKSPADIENIVKESALIATRQGRDIVTLKDISDAMERIDMGIKHKKHMNEQERKMTAYHEAGHLIVLYILHPTDDVFKASIIPRREALGVVHHQPREELFTHSRDKLLADIKVSLGGYVAEKLKFNVTSSGVSSDFKNIMRVAHTMVWRLGMGSSGYLGDYTAIPEAQLSESMKENLNKETQDIFNQCAKDVEALLKKESIIFERFANELLEREELDYDEIDAIFSEYGKSHEQLKQSQSSS